MSTELVLMPGTGELLDPRAATDEQLAEARGYLTDLYQQRNTAAGAIDQEIIRRTDERNRYGPHGEWTFRSGDWTVSVDSPRKRGAIAAPAAAQLRQQLLDRADELGLGPDRIEAAFTVTYSAKLRELDNLASLAQAIDALIAEHTSPPRRSVRVERWRPPAIDATAEDDPTPIEEPSW